MQEETIIAKYDHLKHILGLYGQDMILGMLLMVIGLLFLHWFIRHFKIYLIAHKGNKWPVEIISAIVYFILPEIILSVSLVYMGLHAQLKTFDGKMACIPNDKTLKDVVINYHHTPGRRIKINVQIPYEEDLIRAKQILENIMIADPRVLKTPRPQVWVLDLDDGNVGLGARCWVDNAKYWVTKCELTEKIKLRFDLEEIQLAIPRRLVLLRPQARSETDLPKNEDLMPLKEAADENQ